MPQTITLAGAKCGRRWCLLLVTGVLVCLGYAAYNTKNKRTSIEGSLDFDSPHQAGASRHLLDTRPYGGKDYDVQNQQVYHMSRTPQEEEDDEECTPVSLNEFKTGEITYEKHGTQSQQYKVNFFKYVTQIDVECECQRKVGDPLHGGWHMCMRPPFNPRPGCIVYSFGIARDWTFDDKVSQDYGCQVHSYDPSIGLQDHQRSALVFFDRSGLGNNNFEKGKNGWRMRTFGGVLSEHGHTNMVIDYIKFDIEWSEWAALRAMLNEGSLVNVKQLAFEIHFSPNDASAMRRNWKVLDDVEKFGFRRWYSHENAQNIVVIGGTRFTYCLELVYLNTNFLKWRPEEMQYISEAYPGFVKLPPSPTPKTTTTMEQYIKDGARWRDVSCPTLEKLEWWWFCSAQPYTLVRPCLGITLEGNEYSSWRFDDFIFGAHRCEMHTFTSMQAKIVFPRAKHIRLHADSSNIALTEALQRIDKNKATVDVLRVNRGADTWTTLAHLIDDPSLNSVKQLILELSKGVIINAGSERMTLMSKLKEKGFLSWAIAPDANNPNICLYFLNKEYLTL